MTTVLHVLRSWNRPDPFAPACGCELAPCGYVIPSEDCDQHSITSGKTIRNAHEVDSERCRALAVPEEDPDRRTLEHLQRFLYVLALIEGGPFFFGRPDRWWEDHHFRCTSGHVSTSVLRSEERGDLCLACRKPVALTFPEDVDTACTCPNDGPGPGDLDWDGELPIDPHCHWHGSVR